MNLGLHAFTASILTPSHGCSCCVSWKAVGCIESVHVMLHVPLSFLFSKEFVFGTLTEWLHFYNKWLYCGLWIVNGLLQSTGWPCVVAVMGNWFGKAG